jgi:hypothetical protein
MLHCLLVLLHTLDGAGRGSDGLDAAFCAAFACQSCWLTLLLPCCCCYCLLSMPCICTPMLMVITRRRHFTRNWPCCMWHLRLFSVQVSHLPCRLLTAYACNWFSGLNHSSVACCTTYAALHWSSANTDCSLLLLPHSPLCSNSPFCWSLSPSAIHVEALIRCHSHHSRPDLTWPCHSRPRHREVIIPAKHCCHADRCICQLLSLQANVPLSSPALLLFTMLCVYLCCSWGAILCLISIKVVLCRRPGAPLQKNVARKAYLKTARVSSKADCRVGCSAAVVYLWLCGLSYVVVSVVLLPMYSVVELNSKVKVNQSVSHACMPADAYATTCQICSSQLDHAFNASLHPSCLQASVITH